jgi:putative transposase
MARKPRIEQAGGIYWVTGRCVTGTRLAPQERELFLQFLGHTVARHHWACAGYAILEEGYEVLLTTPEANLSRGMRDLNGEFTQALNRSRSRSGPVFHGRFKAAAVEAGAPFLEVCRAVALSPVLAGLCGKPGKWAHGSYAPLVGEAEGPTFLEGGWVVEHFGGKLKKARSRFEKFVKAGDGGTAPAVKKGLFVGSEAFGDKLQRAPGKIRRGRPAVARPSLGSLFPKASTIEGSKRDAQIIDARLVHGYTLAQIAKATGLHPATISRIARKKELESWVRKEPGKKKEPESRGAGEPGKKKEPGSRGAGEPGKKKKKKKGK